MASRRAESNYRIRSLTRTRSSRSKTTWLRLSTKHWVKSGVAKLRMLYSTACFGKSAIDGWRAAGFKVVSGGRKVYTDSASSQPKFLRAWKSGKTFRTSVDAANKAQKLDLWDKLVALSKNYDKDDLDSYRTIKGAKCIKLNSNPSKKCK